MIYVLVVSHGHYDIISSLENLKILAVDNKCVVCLKDNLKDHRLQDYCLKNDIKYYTSKKVMGFGENNNFIFNKIKPGLKDNDSIVIFNPDLFIEPKELFSAVDEANINCAAIATVNLYRDEKYSVYDNSIRNFPGVFDFFSSYFLKRNKTIINKSHINELTYVDWAAGSFLIIRAEIYKMLGGFDEKYFMYCEDIDFCWRLNNSFGARVLYIPHIKAIHYAQFNNRKFLSKHFLWHFKSIIRFLFVKNGLKRGS